MSQQYSIQRREMPSKLLNELFASMPLENAFRLLTKLPNGILAENVQKMINGIKEAMKNNKWNAKNCGSNLIISENGLEIKLSGSNGVNSVRALLSIPAINLNKCVSTIKNNGSEKVEEILCLSHETNEADLALSKDVIEKF